MQVLSDSEEEAKVPDVTKTEPPATSGSDTDIFKSDTEKKQQLPPKKKTKADGRTASFCEAIQRRKHNG